MKRMWRIAAVYGLVILALLLCVHFGNEAVTTLSETKTVDRKQCLKLYRSAVAVGNR